MHVPCAVIYNIRNLKSVILEKHRTRHTQSFPCARARSHRLCVFVCCVCLKVEKDTYPRHTVNLFTNKAHIPFTKYLLNVHLIHTCKHVSFNYYKYRQLFVSTFVIILYIWIHIWMGWDGCCYLYGTYAIPNNINKKVSKRAHRRRHRPAKMST